MLIARKFRKFNCGYISLLLVSGFATTAACGDSTAVECKWGLAYDFFSQRFFADSLIVSGGDSSLQRWEYSRHYLNDAKFWLSVDYRDLSDLGNRVSSYFELGREQWRLRVAPVMTFANATSRLVAGIDLERKDRFSGIAEPGDQYWHAAGRARYRTTLSDNLILLARIAGEATTFDSMTSSTHDFVRGWASLGVEAPFGSSAGASVEFFGGARRVPDSAWLGYQSLGVEGTVSWIHSRGDVSGIFRAEEFDYLEPDNINNHIRLDGMIRSKHDFHPQWPVFLEADADAALYDRSNFLNQSVGRFRSALQVGRELTDVITISMGPQIEWLDERTAIVPVTPDYFEIGGRFDADILADRRFFSSLQVSAGNHDVIRETETFGDYTYLRIAVIADGRLSSLATFNVLWTSEWEWHERASDNTFSHFLSASISRAF